jgi:large repetitive protein
MAIFISIKRIVDIRILRLLVIGSLVLGLNSEAKAQCTVTGVSGSGFLYADFCAPAYASLYYEFTFGTTAPPQPTYRVLFFWGDGTPAHSAFYPVQSKLVGPLTVYYVRAEKDHTFPAGGNCEYNVNMVLVDNGFQCPDSRQVQIIANWHQDDVALAGGVIALNPTPRHDVCIGLPLVDFRFTDASIFACNIQQNPVAQKPNHTTRHQQYIYGTNPAAGQGIPNLFIKVGTAQTLVRLTDGSGNPVANSWDVDPTTGLPVTAYSTASGYFEGPVVPIAVDAVTGAYSKPQTYPILFDGVGTVFQDQFQITLRNWNICNPWNGSQTNPNSGIANTATSLIYIVDGPLANAGIDGVVCADGSYIMTGSVVTATSSLWTSSTGGTFLNATSPSGAVYTPSAADIAAGFVDLTLHAYGSGLCLEHTDVVRLTIIPVIANNTVAAAQTICNGQTPSPLTGTLPTGGTGAYTYQWQSSTTSAVAGFGPASGTNNTQNYTPGALTATTWYRRVITSGVCSNTSPAIQITVLPAIANNTVSAAQTICSGATPAGLTGTLPTGGNGTYTYLWESSTTSAVAGFAAASGTNNTQNYTPGALAATTWYRRTVTSGPCTGAQGHTSAAIQITVQPVIANNSVAAAQTICNGQTPAALTGTLPTGGSGAYTYQWQSSTTSAVAGFAAASGTNNTQNYTPGALATTTWYRRRVISGSCTDFSTAIQITVLPSIANNTVSAAQTICNGQTPVALTGTLPTGGSGAYTYQWQSSTTSAVAGFAAASGTNNTQNYTPAGAFTQTTWYRRVITSGACTSTSAAIQITVLPAIGNNTVSAVQTICNGQTPAALSGTLPTGGNGTFAYLWESSTTSAVAGFAAASGTNNTQNYTPGALATTTWYRRTVTSGPCTGAQGNTSAAIEITVLPSIANNTVSAAQTICNSQTPSALTGTLPTGGSGAYTYQWQSSTTSAVAGFAAASGTNNTQNYTPGALAVTTWYRRVVTSGACSSTSTAIQITVLPAIGNNTVSAVQTICSGQTPAGLTGTLPTGGNGTFAYLWESSTTSAVAGFAAASGTNNTQNYTPGALAVTTWYRRTVTSGPCTGAQGHTSAAIQITVLPSIANNTVAAAQTICNGQTPAALTGTLPTGGTGGYTYQWQSSTTSAVAGFAAASGTNNTQNYTPAGAFTQTTWYRRVVTSGACSSTSGAIEVTVLPPIANNVIGTAQSICNNTTPAPLTGTLPTGGNSTYTYQWQWSVTSAVAGFSPAGGTNNLQNYTPTGLYTQTTWFRRVVTSGPCAGAQGSTSAAIEITVGSTPTSASLSGNNNVCFGTASTFSLTVVGGAPPYKIDYTLEGVAQAQVTGYNNGDIISLGALAPNPDYEVQITKITDACNFELTVNLPALYTFAVHPIPSAAGTTVTAATICYDGTTDIVLQSTVPSTNFTWTVSNLPAVTWVVGRAPAGGTRNNGNGTSIAQQLAHTGTEPVTVTYTINPTGSSTPACPGPQITRTVVVNPRAQVNDPTDMVLCNNGASGAINFTTNRTGGTTTYAWSNSNTAIGLGTNGTGNIASFTATNTGTAPISATITVTPTFTNGAVSCVGPAESFTITVNPTAQVTDPADMVLCNSGASGLITFTTNRTVGTTTYAWSNNNTAIGLGANGTGNIASFTATNAGTSPISATITVTPTFTNGSVSCVGPAETFTITVNPTAQVTDPANMVLCNNGASGAINFATNRTGGTTTYAWSNTNTAIGLGANGTGNITSFTATNGGTSPISGTVTVTPTFTNGLVSCVGPAETFTITVNPTAQVNDPVDMVLCNNGASGVISFSTNRTGGTTTYAWSNSNTAIGLGANGTGNIATFTATNAGTSPISATITVTPTFTNGSVSCVGPAETFTITVNPTAQVTDPADMVLCNNAASGAINFATNRTGGTTTYAWSNSNTAIGLAASGSGNIVSFTATNAGTAPISATVTVTPTFTNGLVSCVGPAETFTITVNPSAQVTDPANMVLCNNGASGAINFTTNRTGGTTTYAWSNSNTAIGLGANGTGNIATFTATNAGTSPISATITVTPTFTNGLVSCSGTAETFTITVNPTAQVTDPADMVLCNNGASGAINFATTRSGGTTTYAWSNSNTAIGLGANGTGNISSFTATNAGTSPISATITVTPTFTNGSVSCVGPAETFTITVNPTAQVVDPANMVLCNNGASGAINFTTNRTGGTTTYAWSNNNTAIGLGANGTGNIATFTATNAGTSPISATITVTPTFTNGLVSCVGPAETFTITVNPTAQVTDPADMVLCNAAASGVITFATNRTGGTTTYAWSNSNTAIGLGVNGAGNIPSFTATNAGTSPISATITVTPTFTNGSVSCVGPAETFTITVNPTAQINNLTNQTLCAGSSTALVTFGTDRTGGTTTYAWTNSNPAIGLAASGTTDNIASFTANNTGNTAISGTITVTPTFTNGGTSCVGPSKNFTITVNPTPAVTNMSTSVCSATAFSVTPVNSTNGIVPAGTTYSWGAPTGAGFTGGVAGSGATIGGTLTNTTSAAVTATYTVTPTSPPALGSCVGSTFTVTVTVNPSPAISDMTGLTCSGTGFTVTPIDATNGLVPTGTTYSWGLPVVTGGMTGGATGSGAASITGTLINPTTSAQTATYTVTPISHQLPWAVAQVHHLRLL